MVFYLIYRHITKSELCLEKIYNWRVKTVTENPKLPTLGAPQQQGDDKVDSSLPFLLELNPMQRKTKIDNRPATVRDVKCTEHFLLSLTFRKPVKMLKWKGKQKHWNLSGCGWNPDLTISGQVLELAGFCINRKNYLFPVYSGRKKKELAGNLHPRGGLWWCMGVLCKSPAWVIALATSWLPWGHQVV